MGLESVNRIAQGAKGCLDQALCFTQLALHLLVRAVLQGNAASSSLCAHAPTGTAGSPSVVEPNGNCQLPPAHCSSMQLTTLGSAVRAVPLEGLVLSRHVSQPGRTPCIHKLSRTWCGTASATH